MGGKCQCHLKNNNNIREVANRLKLGESVAPEHFDCASVLFSDLVAFTQLTSRLSPLGTVNVISQLFGAFDAIIEEHDAYKVETIGQSGYSKKHSLPCFLHLQATAICAFPGCHGAMGTSIAGTSPTCLFLSENYF
jgi:class 3 adenylate cyclase